MSCTIVDVDNSYTESTCAEPLVVDADDAITAAGRGDVMSLSTAGRQLRAPTTRLTKHSGGPASAWKAAHHASANAAGLVLRDARAGLRATSADRPRPWDLGRPGRRSSRSCGLAASGATDCGPESSNGVVYASLSAVPSQSAAESARPRLVLDNSSESNADLILKRISRPFNRGLSSPLSPSVAGQHMAMADAAAGDAAAASASNNARAVSAARSTDLRRRLPPRTIRIDPALQEILCTPTSVRQLPQPTGAQLGELRSTPQRGCSGRHRQPAPSTTRSTLDRCSSECASLVGDHVVDGHVRSSAAASTCTKESRAFMDADDDDNDDGASVHFVAVPSQLPGTYPAVAAASCEHQTVEYCCTLGDASRATVTSTSAVMHESDAATVMRLALRARQLEDVVAAFRAELRRLVHLSAASENAMTPLDDSGTFGVTMVTRASICGVVSETPVPSKATHVCNFNDGTDAAAYLSDHLTDIEAQLRGVRTLMTTIAARNVGRDYGGGLRRKLNFGDGIVHHHSALDLTVAASPATPSTVDGSGFLSARVTAAQLCPSIAQPSSSSPLSQSPTSSGECSSQRDAFRMCADASYDATIDDDHVDSTPHAHANVVSVTAADVANPKKRATETGNTTRHAVSLYSEGLIAGDRNSRAHGADAIPLGGQAPTKIVLSAAATATRQMPLHGGNIMVVAGEQRKTLTQRAWLLSHVASSTALAVDRRATLREPIGQHHASLAQRPNTTRQSSQIQQWYGAARVGPRSFTVVDVSRRDLQPLSQGDRNARAKESAHVPADGLRVAMLPCSRDCSSAAAAVPAASFAAMSCDDGMSVRNDNDSRRVCRPRDGLSPSGGSTIVTLHPRVPLMRTGKVIPLATLSGVVVQRVHQPSRLPTAPPVGASTPARLVQTPPSAADAALRSRQRPMRARRAGLDEGINTA